MKAPGDGVPSYEEQIDADPNLMNVTADFSLVVDSLIQMAAISDGSRPPIPVDTFLLYEDDSLDPDDYEGDTAYVAFLTVALNEELFGDQTIGQEFVIDGKHAEEIQNYDPEDSSLDEFFAQYQVTLRKLSRKIFRRVVDYPDEDEVTDT